MDESATPHWTPFTGTDQPTGLSHSGPQPPLSLDLGEVFDFGGSPASDQPLAGVCHQVLSFLEQVLAASGTVLIAEDDGLLAPAASRELDGSRLLEWARRLGGQAIETGGLLRLPASPDTSTRDRARAEGDEPALALPLRLDGTAVGALVLVRRAGSSPFSGPEVTLAAFAAGTLGLLVGRSRDRRALERRLEESSRIRSQLEAYAVDVRTTFAAERRRAEELAAALAELEQTYRATVRGLAAAVEAKDEYTAGHIHRVTGYGLAIMHELAPEEADNPAYEYGFLLHDVGKLGVPDGILLKRGPLTEEEWASMRLHPEIGRRIIEGIPFLAGAMEIVYAHHERWDGGGYPRGLKGDEIPLGAKVFPVADSFDAMTSNRPYRQAMPLEAARQELRRGAGTQFWPEAVETFLRLPLDTIETIRSRAERREPWLG